MTKKVAYIVAKNGIVEANDGADRMREDLSLCKSEDRHPLS